MPLTPILFALMIFFCYVFFLPTAILALYPWRPIFHRRESLFPTCFFVKLIDCFANMPSKYITTVVNVACIFFTSQTLMRYFYVISSSAESIVRLKRSGTHWTHRHITLKKRRQDNDTYGYRIAPPSEHPKLHDKPDFLVNHRYLLK